MALVNDILSKSISSINIPDVISDNNLSTELNSATNFLDSICDKNSYLIGIDLDLCSQSKNLGNKAIDNINSMTDLDSLGKDLMDGANPSGLPKLIDDYNLINKDNPFSEVNGFIDTLKNCFDIDIDLPDASGLIDTISEMVGELVEKIKKLVDDAIDFLSELFEPVFELIKKIVSVIGDVLSLIASGVAAVVGFIGNIMDSICSAIPDGNYGFDAGDVLASANTNINGSPSSSSVVDTVSSGIKHFF